VISALVGIPLLLLLIWLGGLWFAAAVALAAFGASLEFYHLLPATSVPQVSLFGALSATALVLGVHFLGVDAPPLVTLAVALSLLWVLLQRQVEGAYLRWTGLLAGILYLGWLLGHLVSLRARDQGLEWVVFAIFTTFAVDTAAYFVGRAWGRRPLAPVISPKKTWEGAIGGLVGAVLAALALAWVLNLPLGLSLPIGYGHTFVLGVLVGVFAQLGDLAESLLKRSVGVKEAGAIIPGHGGLLDRLDSVIFGVIVVYYYSVWVIR